jgi:hypothetical protein
MGKVWICFCKFAPGCGADTEQLHFVLGEVYNPTKRTAPAALIAILEKDYSELHD